MPGKIADQPFKRIVKPVSYSFLQRNDGIVGDLYFFGAYTGAAFGDIAKTHSVFFFQVSHPVFCIQRMHFQRCNTYKKSWADKFIMQLVLAQHMTHILAQIAFDAFSKLLYPVNILLLHTSGAIGGVRFSSL